MKSMLSQYETLQDYTSNLEKLYLEMRTFKHDYVNIISTLACHIENNDMVTLNEYFKKEIMPLSNTLGNTNMKLGVLSNIKILELKSLLYTKIIFSLSKNIQISLEIVDPILKINMNIIDLTRILGIFLDNSLDAALESKEKRIEMGFIKTDSSILIILKNTYKEPTVSLSQIYQAGYSTKGPNRGIGLYSAQQILNKYDNVVHITNQKDNYFIQHLEII